MHFSGDLSALFYDRIIYLPDYDDDAGLDDGHLFGLIYSASFFGICEFVSYPVFMFVSFIAATLLVIAQIS